jgi:primosomal protein N' (replication factor Y)
MYILECIPLAKNIRAESLSYFSTKKIPQGSLIKVPVRNKIINAVVINIEEASKEKAGLKAADFALKKVSPENSNIFFHKAFLNSVKKSSRFFACNSGAMINQLLPKIIIENPNLISIMTKNQNWVETHKEKANKKPEVALIQAEYSERFLQYKSSIREKFAQNKSVFFCLPQNEDIKKAKEIIDKGIENFVCTFTNDMTAKEIKSELKKAMEPSHPVVIIATSNWLFLNRNDFGMFIIEEENKSGWKTFSRPYIDLRFCVEALANEQGALCVFGDSLLRIETLWRYKTGQIEEFESIKWKTTNSIETILIDSSKETKKEKEFSILSPQTLSIIEQNIKNNKNTFVYAVRKGLAPNTICRDCGTLVECNNCSAPMILYKSKSGNIFRCHQCGEVRNAYEVCKKCGSWRLFFFGSGIDRITEELQKHFKETRVFELYKDVAKTSARALNISESFYKNRGSILVGTEMALSYLQKKVDTAIISSIDSLFSIPDFRIREKIFRLILEISNVAKKNFVLQTRNIGDKFLEMATSGNLIGFYNAELEDRRELEYPPFSVFVKITARGTKNFTDNCGTELEEIFEDYEHTIFNSIQEKKGEPSAINCVLKIPREEWLAEEKLYRKIKRLNLYYEVKVDPDNLL